MILILLLNLIGEHPPYEGFHCWFLVTGVCIKFLVLPILLNTHLRCQSTMFMNLLLKRTFVKMQNTRLMPYRLEPFPGIVASFPASAWLMIFYYRKRMELIYLQMFFIWAAFILQCVGKIAEDGEEHRTSTSIKVEISKSSAQFYYAALASNHPQNDDKNAWGWWRWKWWSHKINFILRQNLHNFLIFHNLFFFFPPFSL